MKKWNQTLLQILISSLIYSNIEGRKRRSEDNPSISRSKLDPGFRRSKAEPSFREVEKDILDTILGSRDKKGFIYDARIRPQALNKTTNLTDPFGSTAVNVNIYLRTINDINDYKMEFAVQITFRQKWMDPRLKFFDSTGRIKYLTLTDPKKVWMPDTFFRNEKVGHFHNILVNNVYIRIFPNGEVLYSIRISLTLSCPMNLKLYPMDRQTCALKIASYGYTTDDITYLWEEIDPVQLAQGLNLPRFNIEKYSSSYCNVKTNTGEYSCLSVDLVFKRQFSYYLITIYIPGCMLVIVSWVNFWLDPKAVPARVALGVTTLLTMSTQTASISSTLPPVAYTKAIDVWQGVCVGFVFSALMEYALVNYALRDSAARRQRTHYFAQEINQDVLRQNYEQSNGDTVPERRRHRSKGGNILLNPLVEDPMYPMQWMGIHDGYHRGKSIGNIRSKRIDVVSRFLFPFIFAVFNVAYWSTYLPQANKEI